MFHTAKTVLTVNMQSGHQAALHTDHCVVIMLSRVQTTLTILLLIGRGMGPQREVLFQSLIFTDIELVYKYTS